MKVSIFNFYGLQPLSCRPGGTKIIQISEYRLQTSDLFETNIVEPTSWHKDEF